ncbi:histidine triad nucleotide-binding protein, partial [Gardnerella vaginalis]
GDYRLVFNTGLGAGQTVFHVHAHVLTGEKLEEGSL